MSLYKEQWSLALQHRNGQLCRYIKNNGIWRCNIETVNYVAI